MTEGARRAYKVRNTFCRRTNLRSHRRAGACSRRQMNDPLFAPSADGISEIPLKRGSDQLFSLPKRKKLAKKKLATLQVDRLAPINCPVRSFSASKGAVPQMVASPTSEAKRLESVSSRNGGFDLMGAVLARLHHANHGTQTVWVCVPRFVGIVIKWMQRCADGTSSPPLGDFCPPCAGSQTPLRSPHPQTAPSPFPGKGWRALA